MLGREVMTLPELLVPVARSLEKVPEEHVNEHRGNLKNLSPLRGKQAELKENHKGFLSECYEALFLLSEEAILFTILTKLRGKEKCSKLKPCSRSLRDAALNKLLLTRQCQARPSRPSALMLMVSLSRRRR